MAGHYTESNYENAIINLFTDVLGYSYAYGPDIDRDYHNPLYEDLLLSRLAAHQSRTPYGGAERGRLQNYKL